MKLGGRVDRGLKPVVAGLVALIGAAWIAAPIAAQDAPQITRVEEIRLDPEGHTGQIRTLQGIVERLVSREGQEPAFYLEDDFGHQLLVMPFEGPPPRGERVTATGVISMDAAGDPILTIFEAAGLVSATPVPTDEPEAASPPAEDVPLQRAPFRLPAPWWVFAIGGAAAVALIAFSMGKRAPAGAVAAEPALVTGPTEPASRKSGKVDIATSALWPESDHQFEGRTMIFTRPDPTLQLRSTRLEVIRGGDEGEEIRFVGAPGEEVTMMFGRAPGEGAHNVTLKQKTVSRTHAVVRFRHGEWLLENLSMTNPTVLNEEVLGVKERLLTEGDIIEMGEVAFRFVE